MAIERLRLLAVMAVLAGCSTSGQADRAQQLQQVKAGCVQAMVASTCRIMQGPQTAQLPAGIQTILVAGVGPVDASLYRRLWQQGDAMCQHLVDQCQRDWEGAPCHTARRLYVPASAT